MRFIALLLILDTGAKPGELSSGVERSNSAPMETMEAIRNRFSADFLCTKVLAFSAPHPNKNTCAEQRDGQNQQKYYAEDPDN